MLNDLLLLNKIRGGDIKVFEDIFRKNYSPLLFFAKKYNRQDRRCRRNYTGFVLCFMEREGESTDHSFTKRISVWRS